MASKIFLPVYIIALFAILHKGAVAQPVFPGYSLTNFINNVARIPASHANADVSFITNNSQMNRGWANITYLPANAPDTMLLTWNQGILNGPGIDILIVCLNNSYSGKADIRLLLSDGTYTASHNLDFTAGMIVSSTGSMTIEYYNCIALQTTLTESSTFTPAAKEIDIASFYNGALSVKGVEFSHPIIPTPDILTVAMTQNATIDPGNTPLIHNTILTGCNHVIFNGTNYTTSTVITDTITSVSGSDSIYNITHIDVVSIIPTTQSTNLSGCNSVHFNGTNYTSSTTIHDTIRSVQNCDSIYNVTNIIITPVAPVIYTTSISGCSSVNFNGTNYTSSTIVNDTIRSMQGCDSVYNVTNIMITAIVPLTNSTNISGCNNVSFNGVNYTASIIIRDTVRSIQGCDSVYNINNIIVTPIIPVPENTTITGCNNIVYNGINYTSSTVLNDTLKSVQGCDSIYKTINIVIKTITAITKDSIIKGCGSVTFNNITYTASKQINDTLKTTLGCDSIYNNISIIVLPNDNALVLTSSANNVYTGSSVNVWATALPGSNIIAWQPFNVFISQTASTQTIVADTTIKILVTGKSTDGCISQASLLLTVNKEGNGVYFPGAFNPNSIVGNNSFGPLGNLSLLKAYSFSVYNRWGILVFFSSNPLQKWNGTYRGASLDAGNFVWQASFFYKGIQKRLQGNVMLIK